ncbi:cytochrome P450 9e2-like [Parasteatoda tepidariorum]|uniref:cytochrome P450 9e2-like n=1 Tax=Parasteatoda tepidariorum TaxID=114398 RepID=UPI0039BC8A97
MARWCIKTRDDFLQLLLNAHKGAPINNKKDCVENGDHKSANNGQDIQQNGSTDAHQKTLTFDELVSQCFSFYLAAHANSASLLTFIIYLLAINENIQENVYQEIREHLQETNGEITYEALQKMKYLDNVISETLRLYPPVVRATRRSDKDYKLGETGITLQKNTIFQLPILGIHRDPKYYPNPEKFDPDRFSAEEIAKRDPNVYFPFGLGPRNCIGMTFARLTSKVCLVYVLSCFNIKTCSQTKVPLEFDPWSYFTYQAKDVTVKLEIRNDCPLVYN